MRTIPSSTSALAACLAAVAHATFYDQKPIAASLQDACPEYGGYASVPHEPYSEGPLELPFQRPDPRCRTFQSDAIEDVIEQVTRRMKDPDLARLFENTFPSTTDTTIKFHTDGSVLQEPGPTSSWEVDEGMWEGPQSFIITGDIVAEWLRDSTNQLSPYLGLARTDRAILRLIEGAIATQAEYVLTAPYCNAFQPPPISSLRTTLNTGSADVVHPTYEPDAVFECKYELDSLAHFLALGSDLYARTGTTSFVTKRWLRAVEAVMAVLLTQSSSTFDEQTGHFTRNFYTFRRFTDSATETLGLQGVGNPLNWGTGLVRSAFRPSDDATILGFLVPANAMMAVQLNRTAMVMRAAGLSDRATELEEASAIITNGIWKHAVVDHKKWGRVFAYEVDGYGSAIFMDDANYPSLLALPLMGFVDKDNEVYKNTRKMILSKEGNPYYLVGESFRGIGGPHIGPLNAWPMSVLIQARTSDNDTEILECLDLVLQVSQLGLIHESVNVNYGRHYTRSWFAWANGVFADTILELAKRKPQLIFKTDEPYEVGK